MLSIDEIKRFFPDEPKGKGFLQNMVKEYLQTLVLSSLSKKMKTKQLVFIGDTCLRFCYGLDRFSEDLDFDFMGYDRDGLRT